MCKNIKRYFDIYKNKKYDEIKIIFTNKLKEDRFTFFENML